MTSPLETAANRAPPHSVQRPDWPVQTSPFSPLNSPRLAFSTVEPEPPTQPSHQ